ncbi:hypothetical protein DMENIID0001_008640 [Sergentomyia squamirostris]
MERPSVASRAAYRGQLTSLKGKLEKYDSDPAEWQSYSALVELLTLRDTAERIEKRYCDAQALFISSAEGQMIKEEEDRLTAFLDECNEVNTKISHAISIIKTKSDSQPSVPDKDDRQSVAQIIAAFEKRMEKNHDVLVSLVEAHKSEVHNQSMLMGPQHQSTPIIPSLKLEPLKIPKFSGAYSEWRSFHDMFKALVDSQINTPDAQKMNYLKNSLDGEALQVIDHLPLVNANYKIAWDILSEKYDDLYSMAHSHIDTFLSQNGIQKPSAPGIRKLQTTSSSILQALDALNVQNRDPWLINIILKKLDNETQVLWARQNLRKLATWQEFSDFLQERYKSLETCGAVNPKESSASHPDNKHPKKAKCGVTNINSTCQMCKSNHKLFRCRDFLKMPASSRLDVVIREGVCKNCLSESHPLNQCGFSPCTHCSQKHNRLLHDAICIASPSQASAEPSSTRTPIHSTCSSSPNGTSTTHDVDNAPNVAHGTSGSPSSDQNKASGLIASLSCDANGSHQGSNVLLATAIVKIKNIYNSFVPCRILLDSGSQINIITTRLRHILKLKQKSVNFEIEGIGSSACTSRKQVTATIQLDPDDDQNLLSLDCLVLPTIIGDQPSVTFDVSTIKIPQDLRLADPQWHKQQAIDLLVGGEHFWKLIRSGSYILGPDLPTLRESIMGWLVVGAYSSQSLPTAHVTTAICAAGGKEKFNQNMNDKFEKEVLLEEPPEKKDDKGLEDLYQTTITRLETERFMESTPFKDNVDKLRDNGSNATQQFYSWEKKLDYYPELKELVKQITHEDQNPGISISYFLTHFCMLKFDAVSSKVRIGFNTLPKVQSGISFNDVLKSGSVVQLKLVVIIWRFRLRAITFICNTVKIFLKFLIYPEHPDFLRFLFRDEKDQHLKAFRFRTTSFRVKSSPFLVTSSIVQVGRDDVDKCLIALRVLEGNFCMNDSLILVPSPEEALLIKEESAKILKGTERELCKFSSKVPEIFDQNAVVDVNPMKVAISDYTAEALSMDVNCGSQGLELSEDLTNPEPLRMSTWISISQNLVKREPSHRKGDVFFVNGIIQILKLLQAEQGRHVSLGKNLVDKLTRESSCDQLIQPTLWWNRPSWLLEHSDQWPPVFVPSMARKSEENIPSILAVSSSETENSESSDITSSKCWNPVQGLKIRWGHDIYISSRVSHLSQEQSVKDKVEN